MSGTAVDDTTHGKREKRRWWWWGSRRCIMPIQKVTFVYANYYCVYDVDDYDPPVTRRQRIITG
jgi:hypothetical protein